CTPRLLHSFPTRRSSDLLPKDAAHRLCRTLLHCPLCRSASPFQLSEAVPSRPPAMVIRQGIRSRIKLERHWLGRSQPQASFWFLRPQAVGHVDDGANGAAPGRYLTSLVHVHFLRSGFLRCISRP